MSPCPFLDVITVKISRKHSLATSITKVNWLESLTRGWHMTTKWLKNKHVVFGVRHIRTLWYSDLSQKVLRGLGLSILYPSLCWPRLDWSEPDAHELATPTAVMNFEKKTHSSSNYSMATAHHSNQRLSNKNLFWKKPRLLTVKYRKFWRRSYHNSLTS